MLPLWPPVEASGCLSGRACRFQPWQVGSCIILLLIWLFWEGNGRRMETWLNGSLKLGMKQPFLATTHIHSSCLVKGLPNRTLKPNQLFCTHLPLPQCFLPIQAMHLPHPPNQALVLPLLVASQCPGAISVSVPQFPTRQSGTSDTNPH